ncbi:MAG: hypothetical protein WCR29_04935 [Bacteroidales bacterium]
MVKTLKSKFMFLLLLVFFSVNLYSQENYIEYQRGITKAENLMFDSMYKESIYQFHVVLDNYSFNFPRDCIMAAQISAYIGDDNSLYHFLKKAVRFGVHIDYINSRKLYSKYHKYPWWGNFINRDYDSLRNEYIKGVNWEYKALCDKYRNIDRIIRDKDQKWYRNEYIVLRWDIRNDWIKANEKYISEVDSLIDIYGFPSYRIIGVEDSTTLHISKYKYLGCSQFNIIYNHYCSRKKCREDKFQKHLSKLLEEVKKGNLSARDYARIMEIDYRHSKKYKNKTSLYYVWYEPTLNPTDVYPNEEEINKRREEIGLSNCYYERKRKRAALMGGFEFWYFDF